MKNSKNTVSYITRAAVVAAIYFACTYVMYSFGSGAIQLRLSEALCVLPLLMPEAVPGLFIGCLIANLIGGGAVWDVIFGSLTTLAAAYLTYKVGYKKPGVKTSRYWLAISFPVILNAVIVGTVVWACYGFSGFGVTDKQTFGYLPLTMLTVGIGEAIAVYVFGTVLYQAVYRLPDSLLSK
ncbi:MAG: QueT transporter family protein [Clostridiales bacterium]|nr:QueT transporter family protein [Clostridiales bacterium]